MPDLTVSVATGNTIAVSVSGGGTTATVSSGGTATVTVAGTSSLVGAGKVIVSSGGLADLTSEQQAQITQGVVVVTTDGYRWVFSGVGSVTSQTNYVQLADITPEWGAISGKPSTFAPSAHKSSHETGGADAISPSDIGAAAASHTHAIADTTGLQTALDAKAPIASPTFTGTVSGITKSMVGLGNVDNTSDLNKPISTAVQTALDGKAAASHSHIYYIDIQGAILEDPPSALADIGAAAADHVHGNITNDGKVGTASGQIVVTGSGGFLTTAATIGASSVSGLATVATSGSYNDLSNKPSLFDGSYLSLSNVPSTFAPSTHTHTASSITDFSTAVAAASPEEVVEYQTPASFPATGNTSLLYIATDDSRAYRWTGSQYVEVGPSTTLVSAASASDLTSGTLAFTRLPPKARVSANLYLWSSFR